jgi:hypothetical protein
VAITNDPTVIDLDKRLPWYKAFEANNGVIATGDIAIGYTAFISNGKNEF